MNFSKKDCFILIDFIPVLMLYFSDVIIVSERYESCLSVRVEYSVDYACVAENGAGPMGRYGPRCDVRVINSGKYLICVLYEFIRIHYFCEQIGNQTLK